MQPAPAVSLACSDGGAWRRLGIALNALAAASVVLWMVGWLFPQASWAVPLAGVIGFAVAAVQARVRPDDEGTLRWDGQGWQWLARPDATPTPGSVSVAIDLGGWLLLRFRAADGGATRWLPAGRVGALARGALFAPAAHNVPIAGADERRAA
jgi:hypothetical protein